MPSAPPQGETADGAASRPEVAVLQRPHHHGDDLGAGDGRGRSESAFGVASGDSGSSGDGDVVVGGKKSSSEPRYTSGKGQRILPPRG